MVKIKKVETAKQNRKKRRIFVAVSGLFLLTTGFGVYGLYYMPIEKANSHLKSISTPSESSLSDLKEEQQNITTAEKSELGSSNVNVVEPPSDTDQLNTVENNFESVQRPTVEEILSVDKKQVESTESIKIDSVGLNLKIIRGTNRENMLFGATTMLENQEMGKGNYALAGHHMPRNDLLFSPILSIEKGDEIILKGLNGEFKYRVVSTKIVDYREGSSVLKESETPTLTLITCDKATVTSNRFIVTATLI